MHQCPVQWVEDAVEVVHADSSLSVAMANPPVSGKVWEGDFLKMADFDLKPIQAVGFEESS
jgi:hypothetical protein